MTQLKDKADVNTSAYFFDRHEKKLGTYSLADEDFHAFPADAPFALTETQFFGLNIPEHDINGFLYLWHHPRLNVTSGGVMVMQGIKTESLASQIFDYCDFLPPIEKLPDFTLPNSYTVETKVPGEVFRTTYSDPARDSMFDVTHTAVSPPMVWPASKHFEQVMRTEGELRLRGKTYQINGFGIRDRSWSEARNEDSPSIAPPTWMTGVFGEDFSFHLTASDDPALDPIWKGRFDIAPEDLCKFGWLIHEGRQSVIVSARKITRYNRATMFPDVIEMEFTDEFGKVFALRGRVIAAAPLNTWPNIRVPTCLIRWECNGRVGHGDVQEAQWNDFLEAFL